MNNIPRDNCVDFGSHLTELHQFTQHLNKLEYFIKPIKKHF